MTCGSIQFPNVPEPHPSGMRIGSRIGSPSIEGNRSEPNALTPLDDIHDERRPWRLVRAALPRDPDAAVCLGELRFRTQVPVAHVAAALRLLDGHGLQARRHNGGLLYWFSDAPPRAPPAQLSFFDVPGTTELHDDTRGSEHMPILAKRPEREYTPCPAGLYQAVCVDAIDLGDVETQWGRQHKAQLKWQVNETLPDGRRFLVSRKYTISLHPKSMLRLHLESWRGRAFTEAELDNGFDLEKLIGANCMVTIVHTAMKDGGTWADVKAIAPLLKGLPRIEAVDYKRATPAPPVADDVDDVDEEPVPF